jgi:hypothetical protein
MKNLFVPATLLEIVGSCYLSMHSWLSPPIFVPIAIFFVSLCPAILGFSFRCLRKKASFAEKSLSQQKFKLI